MKHVRHLAPVALAPLLIGCGAAGDPGAVLETVRATERAQVEAIAAKDPRGAVRNYRDEAVLVAPGRAPVSGADAIGAVFEELLADPNLAFEVSPGRGWVAAGGDLAATTATVRLTTTDPETGGRVTRELANQTVWHRVAGAAWQIVSDHNAEVAAD